MGKSRKDSNYKRALELKKRNTANDRMRSARELGRRATLRKLGRTLDDIYKYQPPE